MKRIFIIFNKLKARVSKVPKPIIASFVFIFASILTQGIGIITMPIFTRLLSTKDMGILAIFNSWTGVLGIISGLALSSGSFSVAMNEFKEQRDQYISSILTLSTLSTSIMAIIFIIFKGYITKILGIPITLIYIMLFNFVLSPATVFWILKERYEYRYKKVAIVSFISALTSSLVAILAVYYFREYEVSLAIVRILTAYTVTLSIALFFYIKLLRKGQVYYSKKYWSFALKFSFPLIIHSLAKQILDVSDRIMIQKFLGLSAAGIYGILYIISSLSLIIWSAINASLVPYMFSKLGSENDEANQLKKIVNNIVLFYAVACIGMILIAPELMSVLATKEYSEAIFLIPPVAAGIFFTSLYNIFSNVLLFYKKSSSIMFSTLIAALANLILNYIFIPRAGLIAAAYTTLFSFVLLTVLQYLLMSLIIRSTNQFDIKFLLLISLVVILFAFVTPILYQYQTLRYMFLTTILMIVILKRNVFLKLVKK